MFAKRLMCAWMGALCLAAGAFAQTYTTIDPSPFIHDRVFPLSINNKGAIAGYYVFNDGAGPQLGFVRDASGTITSFQVLLPPIFTFANSINGTGAVTGYYSNPPEQNFSNAHGYVRDPQGNLTTFDPPGSISTTPQSINAGGAITGYYNEANLVIHGFVRGPNGKIVTFDPPGSVLTKPIGINTEGAIAGYYQSVNGFHGFVRRAGGMIVSFDPPGSTSTIVADINNAGAITGSYSIANGRYFGFVRRPNGKIESFDFPGSFSTGAVSINDLGALTGVYSNTGPNPFEPFGSSDAHGFVSSPEGIFTSLDDIHQSFVNCIGRAFANPTPPPSVIVLSAVFPTSINREGVITGFCMNPIGTEPGWARFP